MDWGWGLQAGWPLGVAEGSEAGEGQVAGSVVKGGGRPTPLPEPRSLSALTHTHRDRDTDTPRHTDTQTHTHTHTHTETHTQKFGHLARPPSDPTPGFRHFNYNHEQINRSKFCPRVGWHKLRQ